MLMERKFVAGVKQKGLEPQASITFCNFGIHHLHCRLECFCLS